MYTTEQLALMREWLEDCGFDGADELTDTQVVRLVARNYDGGLAGFDFGE